MERFYDFVLAIWLRFKALPAATPEFVLELRDYLEADYHVHTLEVLDESESSFEGEVTVSLQLQLVFGAQQMDGDEPTDEAIAAFDRELTAYLKAKYQLTYLELLDDALTSYLLGERQESEQRQYPEPKQRELTESERVALRARIELGNADIYALATEFACSASQVAGIKAAMHR